MASEANPFQGTSQKARPEPFSITWRQTRPE
jgi:hypothetical protein